MPELVTLEKNGELTEVHPDVVPDHLKLGWKRMSEKVPTREDIQSLVDHVKAQEARISRLEGDLDLATDDAPTGAESRVAELEAKLADGTITRGEKGLLTKLKKAPE